jgi:hypothetical protein
VPQKYRVVNLSGDLFERQRIAVQAGINFFDELPLGFLSILQKRERFLVEEFCSVKQNYVPFGITAILEKGAHESDNEPDTQETEQVPDSTDDAQTPSEAETISFGVDPGVSSTGSVESGNLPIDPELENILKLTNDQANDVIVDLEDKMLLQKIIDAPTVKSGTRSAAIRRLNHLNAH